MRKQLFCVRKKKLARFSWKINPRTRHFRHSSPEEKKEGVGKGGGGLREEWRLNLPFRFTLAARPFYSLFATQLRGSLFFALPFPPSSGGAHLWLFLWVQSATQTDVCATSTQGCPNSYDVYQKFIVYFYCFFAFSLFCTCWGFLLLIAGNFVGWTFMNHLLFIIWESLCFSKWVLVWIEILLISKWCVNYTDFFFLADYWMLWLMCEVKNVVKKEL